MTLLELCSTHSPIHTANSFPCDDAFDVCDSENVSTPRSHSTDDLISEVTVSPSHSPSRASSSSASRDPATLDRPLVKNVLRDVISKPCIYPADRLYDETVPATLAIKFNRIRRVHVPLSYSDANASISALDAQNSLSLGRTMSFTTSSGSRISSNPLVPALNENQMFLHKSILPLKPINIDLRPTAQGDSQVDSVTESQTSIATDREDDGFYTATETIVDSFDQDKQKSPAKSEASQTSPFEPVNAVELPKSTKRKLKGRCRKSKPSHNREESNKSGSKDDSSSNHHLDREMLIEKHGWDAESAALAIKLEQDDEKALEDQTNSSGICGDLHEAPCSPNLENPDVSPETDFKTVINKRNRRKKSNGQTQQIRSGLDQPPRAENPSFNKSNKARYEGPYKPYIANSGYQPRSKPYRQYSTDSKPIPGRNALSKNPINYTRSPSQQSVSTVDEIPVKPVANSFVSVAKTTSSSHSPKTFRFGDFSVTADRTYADVSTSSTQSDLSSFLLGLWNKFQAQMAC